MSSKKRVIALRKRILQEWRGLPGEAAPDRDKLIFEVLEKVIQKLGLKSRIQEDEILSVWHEIVGDFLATHSQPLQLIHGILHVRVIQPSIRYELDRVWKTELLYKLQERFGKKLIRDIKFVF